MIRIYSKILLLALLQFAFSVSNAQPDYKFKGGILVSGTALRIGAIYSFPGVKQGIDAKVTILNITSGIALTEIDGTGGFDDALQPVLKINERKNGYVEFKIDFFSAGTNNLNVQKEIPLTSVDVDGEKFSNSSLYEYTEVYSPDGYTYFQTTGSELTISMNGSWARGKNKQAIEIPGIDTLKKECMYTTINNGVSSVFVRVGVDNQSEYCASRLSSLYFKKLKYPSELVLPNRTLLNFNGIEKNKQVQLKGVLSSSHNYDKILIEKSNSSMQFSSIAEMPITNNGSSEFPFSFVDNGAIGTNNYYRLRLVNTQYGIIEISTVLMINSAGEVKDLEQVNSIILKGSPILSFKAFSAEPANIQVTDYNGRVVCGKKIKLNAGSNIVCFDSFNMSPGPGFVGIERSGVVSKFKIVVQ